MRCRFWLVAAAVFLSASLAACGGGGGSPAPAPLPQTPSAAPAPTATPLPSQQTQTMTLGSSGASVSFGPIASGAAASVTFPPATQGAQVTLVFASSPPPGTPNLQSKLRRVLSLGRSVTQLTFLTVTPAAPVTLPASPGFTFSFPAGMLSGNAYVALYDPSNPAAGWNAILGPVAANGANVAFSGAAQPVTWSANTTYVYALVETGTPLPTPTPRVTATPAPTASPTASPTPTPTPTASPAPTASPTPAPTPTATPNANQDWPTMGYDLARTGYDSAENSIGPNSFGTLRAVWSSSAGGQIGEPVVATNVTVSGTTQNILYAGGANGIFYALNADTGAVVWTKQLGTSNYSCGGNTYTFGIAGAPVLDRAAGRVYVGDGAATLHALDLATGAEQAGWPVVIASPANHNFIYGGLTYNGANHLLYAETSSTCDISPWNGRITAINTQNAAIVNTFYPTQGQSGGGIWGFGGASIDTATNNVFVATGNADTTNGNPESLPYGEQIVELSSDLSSVLAHNYPGIPPGGDDEDFGATPLLFQPPGCGPLLAAVNKSGMFFLYSRMTISSGPVQSIQMSIVTDNGDFIGVPAYDPLTNYVYVGLPATFTNSGLEVTYQPGIAAFSISNCTLNPAPVWTAVFGADGSQTDDDTPRSPITIANGVVYVSDYVTKQTFAFNALTGSQLWTQTLPAPAIAGPIVANGKLYTASYGPIKAWAPSTPIFKRALRPRSALRRNSL